MNLSRMAGGLEDMIIGSSGSFTATLWLARCAIRVHGRLFPDGTVSVSIPRTGLPSMTLTLQPLPGRRHHQRLRTQWHVGGERQPIHDPKPAPAELHTTVLRSPNEGPVHPGFPCPEWRERGHLNRAAMAMAI